MQGAADNSARIVRPILTRLTLRTVGVILTIVASFQLLQASEDRDAIISSDMPAFW